MFKVLVCGNRNYVNTFAVHAKLTEFDDSINNKIAVIITGGATGVDRHAEKWGYQHNRWVWTCPADWNRYGISAGPIRNKYMIDLAKPDLILVFPGGKGTEDMIKQGQKAGIDITRVEMKIWK